MSLVIRTIPYTLLCLVIFVNCVGSEDVPANQTNQNNMMSTIPRTTSVPAKV